MHFNPLPPHGGRPRYSLATGRYSSFQSTPSAWRETALVVVLPMVCAFQSTPSAWRETYRSSHHRVDRCISIHSLRMEGDIACSFCAAECAISIHSLRMEGDLEALGDIVVYVQKFQSTPSAWRETESIRKCLCDRLYFNPLPPHGGRH